MRRFFLYVYVVSVPIALLFSIIQAQDARQLAINWQNFAACHMSRGLPTFDMQDNVIGCRPQGPAVVRRDEE